MIPEKKKNKRLVKELKKLDLRVGYVILYSGDLTVFHFHDDISIGREDVMEFSLKTTELIGERPYFNIVIPGFRNDITKEARECDYYEILGRKPSCIAEAVIVKDLPTRMVVDFYFKFRKFPYPTKVFSNIDKALDWFEEIEKPLKNN